MKYTINEKFVKKLRRAIVDSKLPIIIFYDEKVTPDEIELKYIYEKFTHYAKINNEMFFALCISYAISTKNENFEDFVIKELFPNEPAIELVNSLCQEISKNKLPISLSINETEETIDVLMLSDEETKLFSIRNEEINRLLRDYKKGFGKFFLENVILSK